MFHGAMARFPTQKKTTIHIHRGKEKGGQDGYITLEGVGGGGLPYLDHVYISIYIYSQFIYNYLNWKFNIKYYFIFTWI